MYSFSRICSGFLFWFIFLNLPLYAGQDVAAADTTEESGNVSEIEPVEPLQIKLSVAEVRLDVVVLDGKGNPVTDLTAADFEVSQNGKQQKIVSSVYIKNQSAVEAQPLAAQINAQKGVHNLPVLPSAELKREDTSRTIVFVIDDNSMNGVEIYHARTSIRTFVEKQMLTGDMVAIFRTSQGNSRLQMFLSDKRELLARINTLPLTSAYSEPNPDDSHLYRVFDNQMSTLSYCIRALKDMPGRKILIMMTAQTMFSKLPIRMMGSNDRIDFAALYEEKFSRLADETLRAGVVVNFMNISGLQNPAITMEDFSIGGFTIRDLERDFDAIPRQIRQYLWEVRNDSTKNPPGVLNALNPLPIKTGGVTIEQNNFFLDGIGRDVDSLMKGYYLISYEPPAGTFSSGDKEIFHKVKVNVKRKNTKVYTRDGFYNRQENEMDVAAQSVHPLQNAIFSPFLHADLDVNIAAGYVKDAKAGYLVRSWIHLDPKDVKIVETEDGGARINLETVCLTSDINGFVQDLVDAKYTFTIASENKSENIAWIQQHGIRFAMLLPVKKPGSYYVRIAVRDVKLDKIGSAYQYVEIPDLNKKGLALSDIFMVTSAEDINWTRSDAAKEIAEGIFSPAFQGEGVRSPALRTYMPGDIFHVLATVYNADVQAVSRSEIETQSILYRDGKEYQRGAPMPITPEDVESLDDSIPLMRRFMLGSDMQPGEYVLRLVVTDKKNSTKKEGSATQTLSFTVAEKD